MAGSFQIFDLFVFSLKRTGKCSRYTVRQFSDDAIYYLALFDAIFDNFPLFDLTLRHIELGNSVVNLLERNTLKLS